VHLPLVFDNEVDFSILVDNGDALPSVKGHIQVFGILSIFLVVFLQVCLNNQLVNAHSHHPKARAKTAEYEALDLF
jgi:hypothetical protein